MKRPIIPPVFALYRCLLGRPKPAPHRVMAELRQCLRRLAIAWRMHRIDVLERKAATELAYECAHVMQASQNFNALLVSNQQLRQVCRKQLQELAEDA